MSNDKYKNVFTARRHANNVYAMLEQERPELPVWTQLPYLWTSLCPDERFRKGTLHRVRKGERLDGADDKETGHQAEQLQYFQGQIQ